MARIGPGGGGVKRSQVFRTVITKGERRRLLRLSSSRRWRGRILSTPTKFRRTVEVAAQPCFLVPRTHRLKKSSQVLSIYAPVRGARSSSTPGSPKWSLDPFGKGNLNHSSGVPSQSPAGSPVEGSHPMGTQMFHFQPSELLGSSEMLPWRHSQLVLGPEFNQLYADVNRLQPPVDQNQPTCGVSHSGDLIGWQAKHEPESFEPSDFLVLEDESDPSSKGENGAQKLAVKTEPVQFPQSSIPTTTNNHHNHNNNRPSETAPAVSKNFKRKKSERAVRYAFKTRSESDILEDGYKWRKYGKKFVKNSPNPRNYYRCSDCNCDVKKRVERDPNDAGVVITTYEGKHNHESPSVVYYIGKPMVVVGPHHASAEQLSQLCPTEFMFL